jgi:glycosyltransferase involved in cell wall biosynthesis
MIHSRTSVIIPVRNGAKFVAEAIGSALAQLDQADEVIVVDDASTDDTRAVVASVADPRVRLLKGSGRGVSSARNIGLVAATGEYITFLDHDDLWPPERHRTMVSILADNPQVDAVYGRMRVNFDGVEPSHKWERMDGNEHLLNSLCTSLFRRSALDRIGGFDESMPFAEDSDYVLRFIEAGGRTQLCGADALIYRRHADNATSNVTGTRQGSIEFFHRRIMRHRRRNVGTKV